MLALSVDPPATSAALVEKLALGFPVLSDPQAATIRAYGLLHEGAGPNDSDIAIPSNWLLASDGTVLWRRVASNITSRPQPDRLLEIVREQLGGSVEG